MSLIILEGPDGGGKSTLAQRLLADGVVGSIHHHGAYKEIKDRSVLAQTFADSMLPALEGQHNLVLDRSWLSEPIYGQVYRKGACRILKFQARMLERVALTCQAVKVLCLPKVELCINTFERRIDQELLDNSGQLRQVWSLYHQLEGDFLIFDRGRPDDEDYLMILRSIPDRLEPEVPGAGAWRRGKSILIVGDQASGDPLFAGGRIPFFNLNSGGCSAWLTQHLEDAGISESQLYWVNARRPDGTWEEGDWVKLLDPPVVVSLGKLAYEWCRHHGIAPLALDHPQYHKRFKNNQIYPLGELLLSYQPEFA